MKYFFWIAFAVFLAASIPHVAYFFASFEPSSGPEGIWWWGVSYAIAISIDVTVYLLSWTAFQRYRQYHTARAVWQHWLLIFLCTVFSWAVNWAYAKQFHNPFMLSAAESSAPWLVNVFPFMASAFPLLGIVYTMMAETITETSTKEKKTREKQITIASELVKPAALPVDAQQGAAHLHPTEAPPDSEKPLVPETQPPERQMVAAISTETTEREEEHANLPNTDQFVALKEQGRLPTKEAAQTAISARNQDKLRKTIAALRTRPDMTDEALAQLLSLKRPASARFWRVKAAEISNEPDQEYTASNQLRRDAWVTTGPLSTITHGIHPKR